MGGWIEKLKAAMLQVLEFFETLPEMWGEFGAFLGSFFGVLPEQGVVILNCIVAGVVIMVVIGLYKVIVN